MIILRINAFLSELGQLNYYTTRDSLPVYLRCDRTDFQISNSITGNVKNPSDLRVSSSHVFFNSRPLQRSMPSKNLNSRIAPYQVNLAMAMLLLSGDIQLNPGQALLQGHSSTISECVAKM